ncbi:MAG TPA: ATP-binding protein [Geobacteraceae bacterium]
MHDRELHDLLEKLVALPKETEWVEFKCNNNDPEEIGKRLSAVANGACLHRQANGYLVFGVEDGTHRIVGTDFHPKSARKGGEELEHWLATRLNPRIDFRIFEFACENATVALFEVPAAHDRPVKFLHKAYIRVGSITRDLGEFPDKEKKIWQIRPGSSFETDIALGGINADEVLNLLDYPGYFDLMKLPLPTNRDAILEKLCGEKLVVKECSKYHITNLGGILFAKNLNSFEGLARKAPRVIIYEGKNRIKTVKDLTGTKGYAVGFEGLIDYINDKLPSNEEIKRAFRETVRMYPEIAIRELVANALIHQDFHETGAGPTIEIFDDRLEITNPGRPIITTMRFIDEFQSRNEKLASLLRRVGVCEEQGSGIDKVIFHIELFQLPAPEFIETERHTKVVLHSFQPLNEMDRKDKVRACYQHACLKYVSNEQMTNQSLRERFKIEDHNYSIASRIIADTIDAGLVKSYDPENLSKKHARYIPIWA